MSDTAEFLKVKEQLRKVFLIEAMTALDGAKRAYFKSIVYWGILIKILLIRDFSRFDSTIYFVFVVQRYQLIFAVMAKRF